MIPNMAGLVCTLRVVICAMAFIEYGRQFGRKFPPMLLECLIRIQREPVNVVCKRCSPRAIKYANPLLQSKDWERMDLFA